MVGKIRMAKSEVKWKNKNGYFCLGKTRQQQNEERSELCRNGWVYQKDYADFENF